MNTGTQLAVANQNILAEIARLKVIKASVKALQKEEDEIKRHLDAFMQESEQLITEDGELILTYGYTNEIKFFDSKRFAAQCPDLYAAFIEYRDPIKRLILK